MNIEIIQTADGSHSLFNQSLNETYHSIHGAIQESQHVFIKAGLQHTFERLAAAETQKKINVLEIGLGTGLNAFLTFLESQHNAFHINYTAIEAFPISLELAKQLNYIQELQQEKNQELFYSLHTCEWEKQIPLAPNFTFRKIKNNLQEISLNEKFDLIYFDAFAPDIQPELWTEAIFEKIIAACNPNACLVTYCAKGIVKRTLKKVGFSIESIPGPPGKREMVRGNC